MSIDGQGHFFTIWFPGFVCFVLYLAKIAGERLQDHWSSGINFLSLLPRRLHIKLALIGQTVSEEKTFEIVNGRTTTDAGPWVSYKLTYEPMAQVS